MRGWITGLIAIAAVAVAATVLGWRHYFPPSIATIAVASAAVTALLLQFLLNEPDRHSARRHAWVSIGYTLAFTWSTAAAVTLGFDAWAPEAARAKQSLLGLLLLVAPNVGGVLALTRSVRTRSETGATLRELSTIRVAALSTPVIEESVRTFEARNVEELVGCVARMLRLTVSLPLTRELLDEAVLWVRNDRDRVWFILASSEIASAALSFTMPVLTNVKPREGIVANLAIAAPPDHPDCFFERDVFLCRSGLDGHPWYVPNVASTVRAMVAVLLRDGSDVIGVLSLTTREPDMLPLNRAQRAELFDIMCFWSHSFLIPIKRLREL